MSEYAPEQYATFEEGLSLLGYTKAEIEDLDEKTKNRFIDWTREGNMNVETELSPYAESMPLANTSKAYRYAKNAVLNWIAYKRRDKEGSTNAKNAKDDHEKNLAKLVTLLISERTDRTKTVSIAGPSQKDQQILLPSQIDTQFY